MRRDIMVLTSVLVALSLGPMACSSPSTGSPSASGAASVPTPAEPRPAEADDAKAPEGEPESAPSPTPKPEPAPAAEAPPVDLQKRDLADLCQGLCVQRNQMRAVAAEVIDADCREQCAEGREVDPDCAAAAKAQRAKLESKPMRKRARHFWTLLSDPALSCGADDPVLKGLATASASEDPATRDAAMREQILADPWIASTCPAGAKALAETSVDAIVEACPIAGATVGASIHPKLDTTTFLAVEVVRTHWRALGATSSDHEIMLSTVLLSTALGNE